MSYLVVFFLRKIQRLERGNLRAALHHSLSHFFFFSFWRGDAHENKPGANRLLWGILQTTLSVSFKKEKVFSPKWKRVQSLLACWSVRVLRITPEVGSRAVLCGDEWEQLQPDIWQIYKSSSNCSMCRRTSTPGRPLVKSSALTQRARLWSGSRAFSRHFLSHFGTEWFKQVCRCPVFTPSSSDVYADRFVGYSISGAYAPSAVQCASRKARGEEESDKKWQWRTAGGARRTGSAPSSQVAGRINMSMHRQNTLTKSHSNRMHLPEVWSTANVLVGLSMRLFFPPPTKLTSLPSV